MLKDDYVNSIIKNAAKLTAFVKKSNVNSMLKKTLKPYVRTRWNSAFTMLDMIVTNFEDIFQILCDRQRRDSRSHCLDLIVVLKKDELIAIKDYLKHFKQITDHLEGDQYETLSMIWPTYDSLRVMLEESPLAEDNEVLQIIEKMKFNGRKYLHTNTKDFEPNIKHKMACVLNPYFKKLPSATDRERQEIYHHIESLIQPTPSDSVDSIPLISTSTDTDQANVLSQSSFEGIDFLRSFYSFDSIQEPNPPYSELENYLKHPILPSKLDSRTWWNTNRNSYPELFKLYAKLSCIPATSSSGERVFSQAGLVLTNRRSCILPENLNDLLIARNKL